MSQYFGITVLALDLSQVRDVALLLTGAKKGSGNHMESSVLSLAYNCRGCTMIADDMGILQEGL